MDLDENDYILGVWYAESNGYGNWLCLVKKGKEPDTWEIEYRFRYYEDDLVFNSKDRKNKHVARADKTTEEEVKRGIDKLFEVIKIKYSDQHEYLDVRGNFLKMVEKGAKTSWMNIDILEIPK